MAFTEKYANFDLATGSNDGTSEANAWQTPGAVSPSAGDRVNIKKQSSPYDLTSTVTFSTAGTLTAPIYYRGYTTTIGDGGLWEVAYNASTANLDFSGNYNYVEGVSFQPGATVNLNSFLVQGTGSWAIRCDIASRSASTINNMIFSRITLNGSSNITVDGVNNENVVWHGCFVKRVSTTSATTLVNLDLFDRSVRITNCVFAGNGNTNENGIFIDRASSGRGFYIENNRFYDFDSGILIDEEPDATKKTAQIIGNTFSTMAAYAIERTNTEVGYIRIARNHYHSCTSGFTNYSNESELNGNTSLSADPFVDSANDDMSLNSTASGGQVLRDAGFPINHPYDWDNMTDQAVQEGGGLIIHPGMAGGMRG